MKSIDIPCCKNRHSWCMGICPLQLWIVKKFKILTTKVLHDILDSDISKIYNWVFWILMPCTLVGELQTFRSNKVPQIFKAEGLTWTSWKNAPQKHLYHLHDYMVSYPLWPKKLLFCQLPCCTANAIAICHITHIHKIRIFIIFDAQKFGAFPSSPKWWWQDTHPCLSSNQHLCLYSSTLGLFSQFQGMWPEVLLACPFYCNKLCYSCLSSSKKRWGDKK
jgi:hypothetical protein